MCDRVKHIAIIALCIFIVLLLAYRCRQEGLVAKLQNQHVRKVNLDLMRSPSLAPASISGQAEFMKTREVDSMELAQRSWAGL